MSTAERESTTEEAGGVGEKAPASPEGAGNAVAGDATEGVAKEGLSKRPLEGPRSEPVRGDKPLARLQARWRRGELPPPRVKTQPPPDPNRHRAIRGRYRTKNQATRVRAYEMYLGGVRKSGIALELGVTPSTIGVWSRQDHWDERMTSLVAQSEQAVERVTGDAVAAAISRLRDRLNQRLNELEALCGGASAPNVRVAAIKLWFALAKEGQHPDMLRSAASPGNLELISDLAEPTEKEPR